MADVNLTPGEALNGEDLDVVFLKSFSPPGLAKRYFQTLLKGMVTAIITTCSSFETER